ncbi:MAG: ATP-binding protein [Candidatus Omnitrophica bacterium]|nr:ATP-binding protein [Candidatus Omnitrophota bacterium]
MPELVIISGKGGTGKTSVTASLAVLARPVVLADCDVDASNLHLVIEARIRRRYSFIGGQEARIRSDRCVACGKCKELCRFDAVCFDGPGNDFAAKTCRVDPLACEGCGVCVRFCPSRAVDLVPAEYGQWFISDTRSGPMVHARLSPASGNTGKLVGQLRSKARELAADGRLIICDGSPGIGCPVIASLAGADLALIVAEPTRSSLNDLARVFYLCGHFGIETMVCINKWDLNEFITRQLEIQAQAWRSPVVGRIRYDPTAIEALFHGKPVVEYDPAAGVSEDLRRLWEALQSRLSALNARPASSAASGPLPPATTQATLSPINK